MPFEASIDPVDFDEAIEWFRSRVVVSKATWERMTANAKRRAFFVADLAQLDLVHDVWKAIDRAIADGTTLDDFRRSLGEKLRSAWADDVSDPAWRIETIFRTNVQSAYSAGRYRQQHDPAVLSVRPFLLFDAILDGRETAVCREANGTLLPADHPWFHTHTPPCHFNCRSGTTSLTEKQAGARGGTTGSPTKVAPDKGFGERPNDDPEPPAPTIGKYPKELDTQRRRKAKAAPPPAPKPQIGIRAGVHAKEISSPALSKDELARLLESVADDATLAYLESNPLGKLNLPASATTSKGKKVNGLYRYKGPELSLSAKRDPSSYGQKWEPGKSWSLSTTAKDAENALARTLRHELGHHIHGRDSKPVLAAISAAFKDPKSRPLTKYAKSDPHEYFAESYAAYYHIRKDLQARDPVGFAMVESVLRLRGILP